MINLIGVRVLLHQILKMFTLSKCNEAANKGYIFLLKPCFLIKAAQKNGSVIVHCKCGGEKEVEHEATVKVRTLVSSKRPDLTEL